MEKRYQQLFKGKRIEFPLATGAASHVSLVYDEKKNPYLLCFTSMYEEKAEFTVALKGCRIINNITEIGPCIHIITSYEEYQFQCRSKDEFADMSQFFNMLGFPVLGFKHVYVLNRKIGKGSFSTAYIGTNTLYGNKVVIKEVDKSKVKESNVYTEIEVLRKVMHKYIIKLISAYEQDGYVYLVLEYLKGGELFEYLNNKGTYSEQNAKKAMRKILIALEALHSNGVVHRDLKMENLMLEVPNDPCSLKIIDFGLASFLNSKSMNMRCGSPGYVAPEILKYAPYGTKVDIFSLGVILFNILCGYPPFRGTNVKEIFKKNMKCHISFNTKHWIDKSDNAKEVILWMCSKNPENRCTALQALGHPWFMPKLTDMCMMKNTDEITQRDNVMRKIAENDLYKKCKHYQIENTDNTYQTSGNSSTKNGYSSSNTSPVTNSKTNIKESKKYFDTTLKMEESIEDKTIIKNKNSLDNNNHNHHSSNSHHNKHKKSSNAISMYRKNCDILPRNVNEYDTIPIHGHTSPIEKPSSSLFPINYSTKKSEKRNNNNDKYNDSNDNLVSLNKYNKPNYINDYEHNDTNLSTVEDKIKIINMEQCNVK